MRTTFIETSFVLASLLTDDAFHERAVAWKPRVQGALLTTEYVLVEVADCLRYQGLRDLALGAIATLRGHSTVRIVPAETSLMNEGLVLFGRHSDKSWSLTDCISFAVVRREGVPEALTSDRDFEQAGFKALLRQSPQDSR